MRLVVEVAGVDGALRRMPIELGEGGALAGGVDVRALLCDKAGVPPALSSGPGRGSPPHCSLRKSRQGVRAPAGGLEVVLSADFADNILLRLSTASLATLSGVSRLTRARCGRDVLWLVHLRREFYRGSGVSLKGGVAKAWAADEQFRLYLVRTVALFRAGRRAPGGGISRRSKGCCGVCSMEACERDCACLDVHADVHVGELQAVYAERMNERQKVRYWQPPFVVAPRPAGPSHARIAGERFLLVLTCRRGGFCLF